MTCSPGQPTSRQRSAKPAQTPSLPSRRTLHAGRYGVCSTHRHTSKCSLNEGIHSPVPQGSIAISVLQTRGTEALKGQGTRSRSA